MRPDWKPLPWQAVKVDETRCRASVYVKIGTSSFTQCSRKPVEGGRYCRVHTPDAVAARAIAATARYEANRRAERKQAIAWHGAKLVAALRSIAAGHNDPRTLAAEVLDEEGFSHE